MVNLMHGDCIELMKQIPAKSVDMILCDLPYGTTANKWDYVINCNKIFEIYKQIIKNGGVIALFSQLPFSTDLINANRKWFRYEWIWEKTIATGFFNAKKMPLKTHENILIFYNSIPTYNPQFSKGKPYICNRMPTESKNYDCNAAHATTTVSDGARYPKDILKFKCERGLHPTQKPVALLEYLIKTYTNEGETVLDNCMGSGSTGVACVNTNRNFIGMELDDGYFRIAQERINKQIISQST